MSAYGCILFGCADSIFIIWNYLIALLKSVYSIFIWLSYYLIQYLLRTHFKVLLFAANLKIYLSSEHNIERLNLKFVKKGEKFAYTFCQSIGDY